MLALFGGVHAWGPLVNSRTVARVCTGAAYEVQ